MYVHYVHSVVFIHLDEHPLNSKDIGDFVGREISLLIGRDGARTRILAKGGEERGKLASEKDLERMEYKTCQYQAIRGIPGHPTP